MAHDLFVFAGKWQPIGRQALLTDYGIITAMEAYVTEMRSEASVVIFRPSGKRSVDWHIVAKVGEQLWWYFARPEYVKAKSFAERLLVGFSLFGESALHLPLL